MSRYLMLLLVPLLVFPVATAEESEGERYVLPAAEKSKYGWLGVFAENLSEPMLIALDIDHGVLVSDVADESPAREAGIEKGDVIIELDGEQIEGGTDLRHVVRKRPGKKVNVLVKRRGKAKRIGVALSERESSRFTIECRDWSDIPEGAMRIAAKALRGIGPHVEKRIQVRVLGDEDAELDLEGLREELEELREELEEQLEELREELEEAVEEK